jgi:hypothetical protein
MRRWLALSFGLAIAAAAGYAILAAPRASRDASRMTSDAPLEEIDASSRAHLERILEQDAPHSRQDEATR